MRSLVIFCNVYLIPQKPNLIPTIFPIMLIYNTNKIYECNPHFILFQFIEKSNDINHYLKHSDNIRFELISDTQNTSNHYESHEWKFRFCVFPLWNPKALFHWHKGNTGCDDVIHPNKCRLTPGFSKLKKLLFLQALIRSAVFVLQILFTKHHKEIIGQISCIHTDSTLPSWNFVLSLK